MNSPLNPTQQLPARTLYLQPPTPPDMAFIRHLWSDPETMRPVGGPILLTDMEAATWYAHMVDPGRGTDCYCLIRLLDGTPVGEISFHRLNPADMSADLNIKVMASARGRGIGREALRRFVDFFFRDFGGRTLNDKVAPGNAAGQAALAVLGFRLLRREPDGVCFQMTRAGYDAMIERDAGRP